MVQLAPVANLLPQVLEVLKSLPFVPASVMLVIVKGAVPGLVSVTNWAALVVKSFWIGKVT
jgi:hypothetical protein